MRPPEELRTDFPALSQAAHGHPLAYLDNAATTQKPKAVLDTVRSFYEKDYANVHRGLYDLSIRATEAFESSRRRVADFIGAASPEEIVFTRGTTEAINLLASTAGRSLLQRGDGVLLTEMEHHANLIPWQMLGSLGIRLSFLPVEDEQGTVDWNRIEEMAKRHRVRLLAFTHVSNSLGKVNPAAEICARARSLGLLTLVDAAQSAGHQRLSVREIGCDFLAFSGHKMCAPTGIGILYGRQELLSALPPYQTGGEMIAEVRLDQSSWKAPPHRFEAGTPNIGGAIGLRAAIDYLQSVGLDMVEKHTSSLAAYAASGLASIPGIRILGPRDHRAGIVSFVLEGVHAHDLVAFLDQEGLALRAGDHCNQPLLRKLGLAATARASFYLYNLREEVDRLVEAVEKTRRYFAG
ncbi:SufS family cysteine desulfurase [Methylacidimicrobium sp. B4]|uniref:SufS family cysteine desulfurase n=1 Tax=Methylacidimicrobium sp. B4 TaxID=2796139 RepID=UPI001A8DA6F9|nr:SufS family cysteine desulfurase [Methylacidimicrobium sp. B4]QSR84181.1 SufS family cysteine desulfurase [Methylacidimicrobium sp. B4]